MSKESLSHLVIYALAEKQLLLVAHSPTSFKGNRAENKVGEYEDDEADEIKFAWCGQVEAEVREGKVGVSSVKDGKEGWTQVVRKRRKTGA